MHDQRFQGGAEVVEIYLAIQFFPARNRPRWLEDPEYYVLARAFVMTFPERKRRRQQKTKTLIWRGPPGHERLFRPPTETRSFFSFFFFSQFPISENSHLNPKPEKLSSIEENE